MFAINSTLNSLEKKWTELDDWHKSGEGKELLFTVPLIDKTDVSESSETWMILSLLVSAYRCGQLDDVLSVYLNATNDSSEADNSTKMEEKSVCLQFIYIFNCLIRHEHRLNYFTKLV